MATGKFGERRFGFETVHNFVIIDASDVSSDPKIHFADVWPKSRSAKCTNVTFYKEICYCPVHCRRRRHELNSSLKIDTLALNWAINSVRNS